MGYQVMLFYKILYLHLLVLFILRNIANYFHKLVDVLIIPLEKKYLHPINLNFLNIRDIIFILIFHDFVPKNLNLKLMINFLFYYFIIVKRL